MGQPIRRATLGAMAKEYEARGQVAPNQVEPQKEFNPGAVFFGVNIAGAVINPGEGLYIEGFYPSTISYANAVKQIYRNKLKLSVVTTSGQIDREPDMLAITGARQNHIAQCKSIDGGLYFGNVYIPDATQTYDYVDEDGVATNDSDAAFADLYYITNVVNHYAVGICHKLGGGGLTLEEVDDEIDATLATKLKTKNIIVGFVPTITNDGYLHLGSSYNSIKYYGEQ